MKVVYYLKPTDDIAEIKDIYRKLHFHYRRTTIQHQADTIVA